MSDEEDPEVIADLQLRAYTEKSRNGLSEAAFGQAIRAAAKPKIIGQVPCRARCGSLVDWTEEAEESFATFNRKLLSTRDAPLDKTRIVFCIRCRDRGRLEAAAINREHIDRLREVIRRVKASSHPDSEHDLHKQLRELRHPDVEGLLEALRTKGQKQPGTRARKGAM